MNRGTALLVALLVTTGTVAMAAAGAAATTTVDGTTTIDADAGVESGTDLEGTSDGSTELTTSTDTETSADGNAYGGANVAFELQGDAITDYRVDGEQTFTTVAVQSQSETESSSSSSLDGAVSLEAATNLSGANLSLTSETRASTEIEAESGATLSAHDTPRGTLVVESGGEAQYVEAELEAGAEAREDGDRVRVETDGREGVFLVVGDGEVGVTDGNVTADLGENATLAFRSYAEGERDERAQYEESLIAEGNAAVEVTATERDGEIVSDAASYGQETSATASQTATNQVNVTIDRAVHEGTVVMTTVSEEAVGSLENLSVRVDGEAAAEASSKSDLEGAIGSDESRYMVVQDAGAEGQATVYVAVNHFSERTMTIAGDGTDGSDGSETSNDGTTEDDTDDGTGDSMPGFGAGAALIALLIGVVTRSLQ
ncbi:PGF-CTERM sorting domain-containing protein [Haloarchaeobius amylolyticus]|uniref:PGF-CTERM sorting domain-containing protein n=1 Tax=Haloarchaeobius amylolyticus TaxID=1198296 RepID=A0ABD6BEI6_9EURY